MGRYIGGPARKQGELRENGAQPVLRPKTFAEVPSGKALVVLVDWPIRGGGMGIRRARIQRVH